MGHSTMEAGKWLRIVGIGEDGVAGISSEAKAAVMDAELVVGGNRHLALVASIIRGVAMVWRSPIRDSLPEIAAHCGRPTTILASGDPFWFGVGSLIVTEFGADAVTVYSAPSSVSLAAARLGWSLQNVDIASLCGRAVSNIAPLLQPGRNLLVLSADQNSPVTLAAYLCGRGFGASTMCVMEALGGPDEAVGVYRVDQFERAADDIHPLNLMALSLVADPSAPVIGLCSGRPDNLFEQDGQLTKQDVRAITMSALAPRPGELLWDIGLGAGSVAIEWLLAHPANRAIGFEHNQSRVKLAASNAEKFGVSRLRIECGQAPAALVDMPAPDAIFVGGGISQENMLPAAWRALNPGGRFVANAVSFEGEATLFRAQQEFGGVLKRIQLQTLAALGMKTGFKPARMITQWCSVKP